MRFGDLGPEKRAVDIRRLDVYVLVVRKSPKRVRHSPGDVRDAIVELLSNRRAGATLAEIVAGVEQTLGHASPSSVRSYLRLNTPRVFERPRRAYYALRVAETATLPLIAPPPYSEPFRYRRATLHAADCFAWLRQQERNSVHAVVTDPPYGLFEYHAEQQAKLRLGKGGVWRIPPAFDGTARAPLPRFTVLKPSQLVEIDEFFQTWARTLLPVLVPGANVIVATNPLLSYVVASALARAGLERRGEIVRLVMTMRGGDRPKDAHSEFSEVSVMPRSMWEPWLVFRRPVEGRIQDNLRKWKTGGFRRPNELQPFGDVIRSAPTHKRERALAPHPSLKPQAFLRQLVRAVLPLGEGIVLDTFAGSGSTLAAAEHVGYSSIGVENDPHYFEIAKRSIPMLATVKLTAAQTL